MTPKEKARELFKKYSVYNLDNGEQWYVAHKFAIQCALIAVDEILNDDVYDMSEEIFEMRIIYWEEVKQEIQNL